MYFLGHYTPLLAAVEPTLSSYKNIVYTDEGEEITLQVDFNGNPYPSITWFFDGMRLSEDREEGREVTEEGSLHISKVQRNHAGTYDFIVSNMSGSVEGCTKLIVYLKERMVERKTGPVKTCSNPVKQEEFGEHVAKYHENADSGFSEEFDVCRGLNVCMGCVGGSRNCRKGNASSRVLMKFRLTSSHE